MRISSICVGALLGAVLFSNAAFAHDSEDLTNRWLSIDKAEVGVRSVYEQGSNGATTTNQMQYYDAFQGKFFFDPGQKYSLNFAIGAGDAFPGGWSNTSVGNAPATTNYSYLKLLYLDAKPNSLTEIQWGGIGIERGASTAITSYSNAGFMAGERLYVRDSRDLFFDSIAVTFGYLGDVLHPDVWDRAHTLWQNNYQQYLVLKKISKKLTASADYTTLAGGRTLRQALHANVAELRVVDQANVDVYERTNQTAAFGGNVSVSKSVNKVFGLTAGYAAIDRYYGDLNDDAFFHGRRAYFAATLHPVRGFTISPMFDHGVDNNYYLPNNGHFHLAITYDLLQNFRHTN
jgi:hypothetical protein